jgi:molybdate transport system regulatory protein
MERNNKEAASLGVSSVMGMKGHKPLLQYDFRLYLNADGERVLGKGGAQILESIDEHGSIAMAAEELDMSYKFVWDYLGRMKQRLRRPLITTHRGGTRHTRRKGGGGTTLTPTAKMLLRDFKSTEALVHRTLSQRSLRTIENRITKTS